MALGLRRAITNPHVLRNCSNHSFEDLCIHFHVQLLRFWDLLGTEGTRLYLL